MSSERFGEIEDLWLVTLTSHALDYDRTFDSVKRKVE